MNDLNFDDILFEWSDEKNAWLKEERGVGFEQIVLAIEEKRVLGVTRHPVARYKHQSLLIVEIEKYAYVVPFVRDGEKIFFKTIYPSRKMTKLLLRRSK